MTPSLTKLTLALRKILLISDYFRNQKAAVINHRIEE
jgi:hypothetical protein